MSNSMSENLVSNSDSEGQRVRPVKQNRVLSASAIFWFATILVGQWIFFYYIFAFYGYSVINGNLAAWNVFEKFGSTPYVAGDFGGNIAFAAHALGGGIIAFGGALQLIPKVRTRFPRFHRINGYVYLTTVFLLAMSGFYLVLIRGSSPDTLSAIGTCINGGLILWFAYKTVNKARNRDIKSHRKWALRLFLVSSAQWLLRLGTFSYLISGQLLGLEPSFGDLFFKLWTFGCFLVPLFALQFYFYASESGNSTVQYTAAGVVTFLTVEMLIGIIGFTPLMQMIINGEPISF